jgi:hypothetical protein
MNSNLEFGEDEEEDQTQSQSGLNESQIEELQSGRKSDYVSNSSSSGSNSAHTATTAEICAVCLADINLTSVIRALPCDHIFHINCIDKWLRNNASCPVCRCNARAGAEVISVSL